MKPVLKVVATALVLLFAGNAAATKSYMSGVNITQFRAYGNGAFGTCVMGVGVNTNTAGSNTLTCAKPFLVSFDCAGNYLSKSDARTMYDTALLAFVTNKTVSIFVDDERTVNGEVCITELLFVDP